MTSHGVAVRCLASDSANALPIEISHIKVIDGGQVELEILSHPCLRHLNHFAKPDSAIDLKPSGFEKLRQVHLLPISGVCSGIRVTEGLAFVARIAVKILLGPGSQSPFEFLLTLR